VVRRRERQWSDAIADLTAAGLCHPARRDRVRVAHLLADFLLARGDVAAAREALGAALEQSRAGERGRAMERLRAIARLQGDELGLKRWRGAGATLVSLMPPRPARDASMAPAIRAWRDGLSGGPADA
jgi:hypothetical protein